MDGTAAAGGMADAVAVVVDPGPLGEGMCITDGVWATAVDDDVGGAPVAVAAAPGPEARGGPANE